MNWLKLRKICIDYHWEILFGIVLTGCVLLSYWAARFIPVDFYNQTLSPIMNGCIATVSLFGAILMLRHHNKIHVRFLWAGVLLTWMVLATMLLLRVMAYNEPTLSGETISLRGYELLIGNVYAWLFMCYPVSVLRPGWLNVRRALIPLLPVAIVAVVDHWLPVDLRWLLAIIPISWMGVLAFHIRAYRLWCEENYSSMDNIDVQWIWRYITMYLVSEGAYIVLSFSYNSAHAFTQQWLLLFMLAYSTEQILYRQDPWVIVRRAKKNRRAQEEEEEEEANYAEYRATLEKWMQAEKPYLDPEFRLVDMRQVLPLNRTYLSQFINAEYGCSFYQFVTNYRIEEAKRLMHEHPDMLLRDIAKQSGFSSPTVFTHVFTRDTGMNPKEWSAAN